MPSLLSLIERYIQKGLKILLPIKIRRMIVLSSITALIEQKPPTYEITEQLNRILNLCNNPKAIEFPMIIKSIIWKKAMEKNSAKLNNLKTSSTNELITFFLENIPEYLIYGEPSDIKEDFIKLFNVIHCSSK
jgi:hypothetical protein